MEINIRAGERVLYKNGNSGWLVGVLKQGTAEVTPTGLYLPIIPKAYMYMEDDDDIPEIHWAEVNNIFTDGVELEDWMKDCLVTKEDYIKIVDSEDFERAIENAWVSDGEYYYYPVSKYTENWLMKQPFDYILRSN